MVDFLAARIGRKGRKRRAGSQLGSDANYVIGKTFDKWQCRRPHRNQNAKDDSSSY